MLSYYNARAYGCLWVFILIYFGPWCDTINTSPDYSPMNNDDLIEFAEYLGLTGIDADVFYEAYYDLDNRELEQEYDEVYL